MAECEIQAAKVKAILGIANDVDPVFIETAQAVIDDNLKNTCLSNNTKCLIGAYLAAHFHSSQHRQIKSEEYGDAETIYVSPTGINLYSTTFGQAALTLDTSGSIQALGNHYASFRVL